MIQTDTGYKVILNSSPIESARTFGEFISDSREEGIWFALTGQHFSEWLINAGKAIIQFIVDMSDLLMVAGMILLLLFMFGSKSSGKWLYWTICAYISLQMLGLMIL